MKNRFKVPVLAALAIVLPVLVNGCSSSTDNPLCCNEFKVGGTITADIGGGAESQVAAQAVADVSAIAASAVEDLTAACRGIAQDLDADKTKADAAAAEPDATKRMNAWCGLAADLIGTVKASATITIVAKPPACEASISAKANCQAKCSGSASCDLKANPPTCTGGKLEVACSGTCKAKANATLTCEGSCSAECKGSCTAQGGVACTGKCEGTCEGAGGAGTSGVDAQGNCQGTCKGTCSVTKPGVTCTGSCKGECKGECKAEGSASVKCDGDCSVAAEPISCTGGKLEGGCKAEAKCEGNCDASVKAKAHCDPPSVEITFSGGTNATAIAKLVETLKVNLPLILGIQAKLKGVVDVTGSFSANIGAVVDIKAACIPPLVAAAGKALSDVGASVSATASVTGKLG